MAGACQRVDSEDLGTQSELPLARQHSWVRQFTGLSDGAEGSVVDAEGAEDDGTKLVCERELSLMLSQVLDSSEQFERAEAAAVIADSPVPMSSLGRAAEWQLAPPAGLPLPALSVVSDGGQSLVSHMGSVSVASRRSPEPDSEVEVEDLFDGGAGRLALRGTTLLDIDELVAMSQGYERPRRLSFDQAQLLPRIRYESAETQCCSICMEQFHKGTSLIGLDCQHAFHVDCLTEWLRRSAQCPNCRRPIEVSDYDDVCCDSSSESG